MARPKKSTNATSTSPQTSNPTDAGTAGQEQGPSKEVLAECRKQVDKCLSAAVKFMFDCQDSEGGEFFAHLLMGMNVIIDHPQIDTAAVSVTNKIDLYINSYFFVHRLVEDLDLKKQADQQMANARRAAVVRHEILHLVFHHVSRGRDYGNQKLANIAADLVCNSCIKQDVLKIGLFPKDTMGRWNLPVDQTMDYYYQNFPIEDKPICEHPGEHDKQYKNSQGQKQQSPKPCPDCGGSGKVKKEDQQQGQQGQPQPGQGQQPGDQGQPGQQGQGQQPGDQGQGQQPGDQQGQGEGEEGSDNCPTCGGTGKEEQSHDGSGHAVDEHGNCKVCGGVRTFDNHEIWNSDGGDKMSNEMKESLIKSAICRAADATKSAGNLPSAIQQAISMARKKAQIPWQMVLRQFVSRLSNGELSNTKKRISKRYKTRPGNKIVPKLKLLVGVDVSGSISDEEYKIFMNEIIAISKHLGTIEVVEWDVGIRSVKKIKGYERNTTRSGSGGTDPTEALKYANERHNNYDGLLMFTDGHLFSNMDKASRIPLLWVITSEGSTECIKKYRHIKLPKAA